MIYIFAYCNPTEGYHNPASESLSEPFSYHFISYFGHMFLCLWCPKLVLSQDLDSCIISECFCLIYPPNMPLKRGFATSFLVQSPSERNSNLPLYCCMIDYFYLVLFICMCVCMCVCMWFSGRMGELPFPLLTCIYICMYMYYLSSWHIFTYFISSCHETSAELNILFISILGLKC